MPHTFLWHGRSKVTRIPKWAIGWPGEMPFCKLPVLSSISPFQQAQIDIGVPSKEGAVWVVDAQALAQ